MDHPPGATAMVVAIEGPAVISSSERRSLIDVAKRAADSVQVPLARLHPTDRAGGILLIADGGVSPAVLAGPFVAEWDSVLRSTPTGVRCRIALDRGVINGAGDGWSGEAVATAERLVDTPRLQVALSAAYRARIALITSGAFFNMVVEAGARGLDSSTFAPITTSHGPAWIQVVGYPWPPGTAPESPPPSREPPEPRPAAAGQSGGISISGGVFFGDQFTGDKIVEASGDAYRRRVERG